MKTGLFFGSFNPVHVGHMVIAQYMAEFTDLDHVWLVVSPQNPLKPSKENNVLTNVSLFATTTSFLNLLFNTLIVYNIL